MSCLCGYGPRSSTIALATFVSSSFGCAWIILPVRPILVAISLNRFPWPLLQSSTAWTSSWKMIPTTSNGSSTRGEMNISLRPPEQVCVGQHSPIRVPRFPVLGKPQEIRTSGTSKPCFANTGVALLTAFSSQCCLLNEFKRVPCSFLQSCIEAIISEAATNCAA